MNLLKVKFGRSGWVWNQTHSSGMEKSVHTELCTATETCTSESSELHKYDVVGLNIKLFKNIKL